jgi:hypothetical protein
VVASACYALWRAASDTECPFMPVLQGYAVEDRSYADCTAGAHTARQAPSHHLVAISSG